MVRNYWKWMELDENSSITKQQKLQGIDANNDSFPNKPNTLIKLLTMLIFRNFEKNDNAIDVWIWFSVNGLLCWLL